MVQEVLSHAIDNQVQQLMLLMKEERHGQVPNLLLRVLGGRYEVDGFEVTEIDVPSQNVDV
jgi:hypothetical protein